MRTHLTMLKMEIWDRDLRLLPQAWTLQVAGSAKFVSAITGGTGEVSIELFFGPVSTSAVCILD